MGIEKQFVAPWKEQESSLEEYLTTPIGQSRPFNTIHDIYDLRAKISPKTVLLEEIFCNRTKLGNKRRGSHDIECSTITVAIHVLHRDEAEYYRHPSPPKHQYDFLKLSTAFRNAFTNFIATSLVI